MSAKCYYKREAAKIMSVWELMEYAKQRPPKRKVTFELGLWLSILVEELLKDTNA